MKIIGIDLGTTNSCVYYLDDDGTPVLVLVDGRNKFFPSAVWSKGAGLDIIVGHAAKTKLGETPPPCCGRQAKDGHYLAGPPRG